jgi:O-antigen ligase
MLRDRAETAALAATAASLAGALIALSSARLIVVLVIALGAAALVWPDALATDRREVLAALLVPIFAGIGAALMVGGFTAPGETGGDVARLLTLVALVLGGAPAWLALRRLIRRGSASNSPRRPGRPAAMRITAIAASGALLVTALAIARVEGGPDRGIEPQGGILHGRSDTWWAATEAAIEEAPLGAGGESFLPATRSEQGEDVVLFAHNLPIEASVELGLAGLLAVLALYVTCGLALWRARGSEELWLAGPAVATFLVGNLFDWSWHLAGVGAAWALALGVLLSVAGDRNARPRFV